MDVRAEFDGLFELLESDGGTLSEAVAEVGELFECACEADEVAGAAASGGNTGGQSLDVPGLFEQRAEIVAEGGVIEEFGDGVLSVSDADEVCEGGCDPFCEESGAHGGAVIIEDTEECEVASVIANGLCEFEAAASGFVDDHVPLAAEVFESEDVREGGAGSFADVFEESAGGRDSGGVIDVEAFEGFGAEVFVEQSPAFVASEAPVGACREDDGETIVAAFIEGAGLCGGFGDDAFGGADTGEFICELGRIDISEEKASC